MAEQYLQGKLSPYLEHKRVSAVRPFLGGRVLDIGFGSGIIASLVESNKYLGVDISQEALDIARRNYPEHTFQKDLPEKSEKFNTILLLALIEHIEDPENFLLDLRNHLHDEDAQMILTTPCPSSNWIHYYGAKLDLFSLSAEKEHVKLFDKNDLIELGNKCGLEITYYKKFLCGLNQVIIYKKK